MLDPRVTKLAELLCSHSTNLTSKDTVLIHAFDVPEEAVAELVRVAHERGAQVVVRLESNLIKRQLMHEKFQSLVESMYRRDEEERIVL